MKPRRTGTAAVKMLRDLAAGLSLSLAFAGAASAGGYVPPVEDVDPVVVDTPAAPPQGEAAPTEPARASADGARGRGERPDPFWIRAREARAAE